MNIVVLLNWHELSKLRKLLARFEVEFSLNMVSRDGWIICQIFPHSVPESNWQDWRRWEMLQFTFHWAFSHLDLFRTEEHVPVSQTHRSRQWQPPLPSSQQWEGSPTCSFTWKCICLRKKKICVFSEYFLWKDTQPSLNCLWVFSFFFWVAWLYLPT